MLLYVWTFFSFIIKRFEYDMFLIKTEFDALNKKKLKKNCAFEFLKKLLTWLCLIDKNEI